ncbi:alpha-mannosidase [Deinococcus detaillensis]|uniref:Alpha-mannosidase n=1 Tax=Deinococcus detaillensis TaxID=2592048 RepID=A0A553V555_9DEIO|nr:glycoside hydrolase family 38 C-terminal domain-containing protein [Deinococcus detaillensis]TSA87599.1 alpha-mannosidase [Deinococcus detaillensis]
MTNALSTEQNLLRLANRLTELAAWRDLAAVPLALTFQWSGGTQLLKEGDAWPARELPVTFSAVLSVPEQWQGEPVILDLALGGEALVLLGGVARGGLNPYHSEIWLGETVAPELELRVEAVPRGLFGTPAYAPKVERARVLLPDLQVRALCEDLAAAHEAALELLKLGRSEIADLIADALSDVLNQIPIPRGDGAAYLTRAWQQPDLRANLSGLWDEWNFAGLPLPYPDANRPALAAAQQALAAKLDAIRQRYPAEGRLVLSGHAHIDLAWLWPLAETRRKIRRTFATVLSLMERYPDFTFNQSSAQIYAYLEQDDPALFERIKARVAEGRWDVVGGMWVEPDGNLISGESWVRQLLYGQRYFASRFGVQARVCWLPDTFGYAANLPQLLRGAGIPYFFTTKLTWNETNTFPYDLYRWEALDGSQVLAHSFRNTGQGYNGTLGAHDTLATWKNFRGKRQHQTSLFSFGWGDGGGGPTFEMLERFGRQRDFAGLPQLQMTRVAEFYDGVEAQASTLPVWVGEQYFELHRGTYTTQARIKQLNRALEHALTDAETAASLAFKLLGRPYPRETFGPLWEVLLRNQFHDILPGSGVKAIYDDARQELESALDAAEQQRNAALQALSDAHGSGERLVIWNLTFDERPLSLRLPSQTGIKLSAPDGTPIQTERQGDGLIVCGEVRVPGLGYVCLLVEEGTSEVFASDHNLALENEHLRVVINPDGSLASLYDKASGRESLEGSGNQLWLYPDVPREWEAWELDASYSQGGERLTAAEAPERLMGQLEQAVRVRYDAQGSDVVQTYRLRCGSRRLEIDTRAEWRGRRLMLRSLTPVQVRTAQASFETAFGTVQRSTTTNTSWEAAQFEVPGHRFADLSEADFGVSLLTDSKYGYSAKGNVLGLSLLRSPISPDPSADAGVHDFTYALYPHALDWRNGTLREAHDLNAPLLAFRSSAKGKNDQASAQLLSVGHPALRLSALKLCEDSDALLLRVYDAHGTRGDVRPQGLGVEKWTAVNLLEEEQDSELSFTPYRVVSLKSEP